MAASWFLSGNQSPSGFSVVVKLSAGAASCRLQVSTSAGMTSPVYGLAVVPDAQNYVKLHITGLSANTQYYYRVEIDGTPDTALTGQCKTFPTAGSPFSFDFATASCNETASNHAVFTAIAAKSPLLFCHMGDRNYEGVNTLVESDYRVPLNTGMSTANQKAMYQTVPAAYVWDDHDFGGNNTDATMLGRLYARESYGLVIPSHTLPSPFGIYHTFDIGNVRFIMSDLRSIRSPNSMPDGRGKSMMGWTQRAWFLDLITQSASDGTRAIVWGSSNQFSIEENNPAAVDPTDTWRAFSYERSLISRHMRRVGCPPVIVISGDAHEIALRTEYVNSGMQFVVSQNAALDRSANTRYDYWDFGPVAGGGHYSLLSINDDGGSTLTLRCRAYSVTAGGVETNLWDTTIDLFPRIKQPAIASHHNRHRF